MATIALNHAAPMTRYLVEDKQVFRDDPVTIVDVGARWGFNPEWSVFGDQLRVFCFEPDAEECRRLNAAAGANVKYLPFALGRNSGKATFYETALSASSGLYKTNVDYFSRLLNRDNAIPAGETEVSLVTLGEALQQFDVHAIDFIKLDVEGAELDVLMGGEQYLLNGRLLGILSEIRFQEEINKCPIFWQLDQFVRKFGFRLYDLQYYHQSRHVHPYPGILDYRTQQGDRFFAYTTHGQIQDGDALYFRDLLITQNQELRTKIKDVQLLKAAALFEIYCLNDCAAELIISHQQQLEKIVDCEQLLELLIPDANGEKLSRKDYLQKYFDPQAGIIAEPKEANNFRAELQRVYASKSWQITKPLRTLSNFLKRVRARWE